MQKKLSLKLILNFVKKRSSNFDRTWIRETVVDQVFQMISREGFELVFISHADCTKAGAFIGYRKLNLLRTGPMIYVDDLFTFSAFRGQGYAGALLDYVAGQAANEGIKSIHLDSGYMLHTAHRLYLNKGYYLACNHFAKVIN